MTTVDPWAIAADVVDPPHNPLAEYFPGARPEQLPPAGLWLVWLILAGRGFGKTRTGAEWLADKATSRPASRWAILAPTFADGRDTCVEGESGLLAVLDRREVKVPTWNRSMGEGILDNGSRFKVFSADEPERLRGPQHDGAWGDEPASWRYGIEAWDMLQFGLRLGPHPQVVVTGTPKPIPLVKLLLERHGLEPELVQVTRGSTFDNAANLPPAMIDELRRRYEGTRLGRQELYAELLEDSPGALWRREDIEAGRRQREQLAGLNLVRVVVAVDPAVTSGPDADDTGVIVAALGDDGHGYVFADATCHLSPAQWGRRVVDTYREWEADLVVAEQNQGGDMVSHVVHSVDGSVPVRLVHAARGKRVRAEPVASLYEQHRVHHVGGFPELEDQLCTWEASDSSSPDRLDALVWALTDLMVDDEPVSGVVQYEDDRREISQF